MIKFHHLRPVSFLLGYVQSTSGRFQTKMERYGQLCPIFFDAHVRLDL